jgi:hypothetical protein
MSPRKIHLTGRVKPSDSLTPLEAAGYGLCPQQRPLVVVDDTTDHWFANSTAFRTCL